MRRASLLPVLLVNFIGAMGFSLVLPFLVFLVQDFGGNGFIYGMVGATYPAFQFFGAPVLGRWSDRFGRRRVLLISQAGTLLSWLIFGVALFLPRDALIEIEGAPLVGSFTVTLPLLVLVLSRALDGLTGGNISVANAYVADVSNDETRSANFGRMAVSFSAGMIVGPALSGILGSTAFGEALPVFLAAFISFVGTLVIAFWLPESNPCASDPLRKHAGHAMGIEHRDCAYAAKQLDTRKILRGQHAILYVLALQFVVLLSFNFYYAVFPVFASQQLGWNVGNTGTYFTVLSVLMVAVQGPIFARVAKQASATTLIVVGLLFMTANFISLNLVPGGWVYGTALLFALGNGVMWPSLTAFLASLPKSSEQGAVQGIAGSVSSLASIVGLVIGGVFYELFTSGTLYVSAGLAFVAALLALALPRLAKRPRPT